MPKFPLIHLVLGKAFGVLLEVTLLM
uniref:Uncharacterized protein n=1 Tax=Rhizophora mucronata TaxID=61149 RepID=A0A2P2R3Z7_RHIMU